MKHYEQKGNECQWATIAMLAGVEYEDVRREACTRFGISKGKLTHAPRDGKFVAVIRDLYQLYGIGFYEYFDGMEAFCRVPVGIGMVRAVRTGRSRALQYKTDGTVKVLAHAFAYEKHTNGSVTFYDPALACPVSCEAWIKGSPKWEIDWISPLKKGF